MLPRLGCAMLCVLLLAPATAAADPREIAATQSPEPRLAAPPTGPYGQLALAVTFETALLRLTRQFDRAAEPPPPAEPAKK